MDESNAADLIVGPTAPNPAAPKPVPMTRDLVRVLRLPRRLLSKDLALRVAKSVTRAYRAPGGTMTVLEQQAMVLNDLYECGGVLAPLSTGAGKTLAGLLAPLVMACERPMMLIPAGLREKTRDDIVDYRKHFRLGPVYVESYERIARDTLDKILGEYRPDILVLDECHKLKNRRSATVKRLHQYIQANPSVIVVGLSGTITNRSLRDYAHLLDWCLRQRSPMPRSRKVIEQWAAVVDDKVTWLGGGRRAPGALAYLWDDRERVMALESPVSATRSALRRRMVETAGVVASTDTGLSTSLCMKIQELEPGEAARAAIEQMHLENVAPCGYAIASPLDRWRYELEMQVGFYAVADPPPPVEYAEAQATWAAVCRRVIAKYPAMTSEAHVALALMGRRADRRDRMSVSVKIRGKTVDGLTALEAWRQLKPTFKRRNRATWMDSTYLDAAAKWAKEGAGILWVMHVSFGRELARRTGMPYYGKDGARDAVTGRYLKNESGRRPVIASLQAAGEGLNLQMFHRNLVVCPPSVGKLWEQFISRTHRRGQKADEVTFDVWIGSSAARGAMAQALRDARYTQESTGNVQRLNIADMVGLRLVDLERAPLVTLSQTG